MWATIDELYPYRELEPDWDRAFTDLLPTIEAATTAQAYLDGLQALGVRLHDAHVDVDHATKKFGGTLRRPGFDARLIDGQLVIVGFRDPEIAKQLVVGDVIETIDGKPTADVLAAHLPLAAGGTVEGRAQINARVVLYGPEGSQVTLGFRGKANVTLTRPHTYLPPSSSGPHWKRLAPDIGYANLDTLTVPEVAPMLAELGDTRALILDMRGYPNGTAWVLAPLLNVRGTKLATWFDRPQVTAAEQNATHFLQSMPPPPPGAQLYRGKVIVLIDDRAQSQAEHTCLFLNEAARPTFIGSLNPRHQRRRHRLLLRPATWRCRSPAKPCGFSTARSCSSAACSRTLSCGRRSPAFAPATMKCSPARSRSRRPGVSYCTSQ